jgi:hypothetical protein
MCICNFEMQGIKEKQKKQKILRSLCRVYAHGKGPFGHFAVCIHTAKNPRIAYLCVGGASWVCRQALCRACLFTAHSKEAGTTHGNASRTATARHTAASSGTAERMTHGRGFAHGNVPGRTAANDGTATFVDARQRAARTAKLFFFPYASHEPGSIITG